MRPFPRVRLCGTCACARMPGSVKENWVVQQQFGKGRPSTSFHAFFGFQIFRYYLELKKEGCLLGEVLLFLIVQSQNQLKMHVHFVLQMYLWHNLIEDDYLNI